MADISFDYFDHPQNKQVCFVGPFYPTAQRTLHNPGPKNPCRVVFLTSGAFALFIWHMFPLPHPPLTSPRLISAHSAPIRVTQRSTSTSPIYQSHLYIKTLSPQLTPFTLYSTISYKLIVLITSNIDIFSTLFLHPSTTLQTSAVIRPILPTHHSRPSSTTHISSPSQTTGSTGTTRLRYHLISTPSPSKSPLKASTSPPSHQGTAWSSAPPSTHTTSPAPSPMPSPSAE